MTKPIIVVKMPCKLLYVIQVKRFIKCNHMKGVQVMVTVNLQCNSPSQINSSAFYGLKMV